MEVREKKLLPKVATSKWTEVIDKNLHVVCLTNAKNARQNTHFVAAGNFMQHRGILMIPHF